MNCLHHPDPCFGKSAVELARLMAQRNINLSIIPALSPKPQVLSKIEEIFKAAAIPDVPEDVQTKDKTQSFYMLRGIKFRRTFICFELFFQTKIAVFLLTHFDYHFKTTITNMTKQQ